MSTSGVAVAITPVAGSYTLNYEWYSAPGSWATAAFTLDSNGTCTGFTQPCSWTLSGTAFALTFPNPRRSSVTYRGMITSTGLNSTTNYGHMYFGTVAGAQGDWWATKQ